MCVSMTWLLTLVGGLMRLICFIEFRSGLSPPCIANIFSSMIAATDMQLKQSVNVIHNLIVLSVNITANLAILT